jgi:uncharacterized protein
MPGPESASGRRVQPTVEGERYRFLDFIRGVALFGILPVNMPLYALPVAFEYKVHAVTVSGWQEPLAFYTTWFLFEYKFLTVFTLLFGAGLALIHERCERRGSPFRPLYIRRLVILACFALLHISLLWLGDILGYYAGMGLLAMWAADWPADRLRRLGVVLLAVPAGVMLLAGIGLAVLQTIPEARYAAAVLQRVLASPPGPIPDFEKMPVVEWFRHYGPALEQYVYTKGTFWQAAMLRLFAWVYGAVTFGVYFNWRILGLFLVGMSLLKGGWFVRPEGHLAVFRKIGRIGLAVGVPLQVLSLGLDQMRGGVWAAGWFAECARYLGSLGMTAGYLWLAARWFVFHSQTPLARGVAAVGRMALSNYLLQSTICSLLFYGYGGGWYETLNRLQLWPVIAAVWLVMLAWSPLWLKAFRFGPVEWIWRSLTYGRVRLRRSR